MLAPPRTDLSALDDLVLALPPPGLRARAVALGGAHGCVLALDDEVRCWGADENHQLGGARPAGAGIPVAVPGLDHVVELASGNVHTCARNAAGDVLCWGGGDLGEIGDGSPLRRAVPTRAAIAGATRISASGVSSCARLDTGETRCWGSWSSPDVVFHATGMPASLGIETGEPLHIALDSSARSAVVGGGGTVWQWRAAIAGAAAPPRAERVALAGPATDLEAGLGFLCGALSDGVWCWGEGRVHHFGGLSDAPEAPTRLEGAPGSALLGAGEHFVCAAAGGRTYCAGWGELIDVDGGVWTLTHAAARLGALDGALTIDAGLSTVCVVAQHGAVHCVGWRSGLDAAVPPS